MSNFTAINNSRMAEGAIDIQVDAYLDRYDRECAAQEVRYDSMEAEIAQEIKYMKIDLHADGRMCDCCDNIIHGAGHIKGEYDVWDDEVHYYFYCDDCKELAK